MDDVPFAEVPLPTRADIHASDVLLRFTPKRGATWFSVIEAQPGRAMVLVQDQDGAQNWALPSTFTMRYSLKDSGRFNLKWRVSPIKAIEAHQKGGSTRDAP